MQHLPTLAPGIKLHKMHFLFIFLITWIVDLVGKRLFPELFDIPIYFALSSPSKNRHVVITQFSMDSLTTKDGRTSRRPMRKAETLPLAEESGAYFARKAP